MTEKRMRLGDLGSVASGTCESTRKEWDAFRKRLLQFAHDSSPMQSYDKTLHLYRFVK
jgi:hypothetical protein